MDPNILQSLQEIASLLLMIHDIYLKDVMGSDILVALVTLLRDTKLNMFVSILDAEQLRRSVMRNGESHLGYELFYEWLREVGQLVFKADDIGGKKALQQLLTLYILPFAASLNNNRQSSHSVNLPYYTESALEVMIRNADFLYLWFFHIVNMENKTHNESQNNSLVMQKNSVFSWKAVDGVRLNTANLTTALQTCGLVVTVADSAQQYPSSEVCPITDNDLESILLLVGSGMSDEWDGAADEDAQEYSSSDTVDFPSFLYLLELISERASFNVITETHESPRSHRLQTLLKAAAGEMLRGVARGMADADRVQMNEGEGEEGSFDALRPPSVLRWLRQSAVVSVDAADVPWLYQQLTIYADYDCTAGDPHVWRVDRLSFVLARLLEKIGVMFGCTFRSSGEREGGHLVTLMCILPRLFFYDDRSFPSGALPLYSSLPATVTTWREVAERGLALLFEKMPSLLVVDKASSVGWIQRLNSGGSLRVSCCHSVNIRELARFFASLPRLHQVVPQLLDEQLLVDICVSVLGSKSDGTEESVRIPRNCLLEVLFVLVFNYWGVVEPALCAETSEAAIEEDELTGDHRADETQYCARVFELLGRLIRFVLVCVDHSSITTHVNDSTTQASSSHVETSPRGEIVTDVFSTDDSSSFGSSERVGCGDHDLHPMREVAVLLTHYPLASFALSPWDVAQLCSLGDYGAPPSSESTESSPSTHSGATLTDLLRAFSSRFSVSIGDLSKFFAEYYTASDDAFHAELKRASLQCSTMSLFMESRTLRLLHLNNDLLKWEFGRCLARFRSASDPFTEGVLLPFAVDSERTSADGDSSPSQSSQLISHAAAHSWAAAHGFDRKDAQLHLDAISCLTGQTLVSGGYLTFSTFLVFSVRCFAREPTEGISSREEEEDLFVDHIRGMLHVFSQNLSSVQQSMQVRVLRLLFAPLSDSAYSDGHEEERDCGPVLQASLALFNRLIVSGVDASASSLLPPRPPAALWDPPRFVCFCKHLGILSGYEFSVEMAWVAYGLCLRELSPRTAQVWDTDRIVPPVPVLIGEAQALDKLCRCLLLMASSVEKNADGDQSPGVSPAFSMAELCFKTVTPVVCMSVDMLGDGDKASAPRQQQWAGGEYPLLEDVLRYGGSEAVGSLSACQDFLLLSFCGLCEQSKVLLSSPFSNVPHESFDCEASINLVCKFFAASLVLRMGTIAVQAKRSLQPRLRPVYHNRPSVGSASAARNGSPAEAVTMCFAEFEELFLRCAFALWETSGALSHSSHTPNEEALIRSGGTGGAAVSQAAREYIEECQQQQAARKLAAGRKSHNKRDIWGIDFVSPFAAVLRSRIDTTGPLALLDESVLDSRRVRCSSFLDSSYVLEGAAQSVATSVSTPREGTALLDILSNSRLKYSIADPVARTKDDTRLSPDLKRKGGVAEDSPKQPLHTSQQVIMSSSERAQLLQESSEQFVVALDSLLVGSKEALWPVYATYCSCGDSSDPGKLSGPNLFTLLSKLGVLTDRTVLSDIGVLLHQISTHSFCTSAAGSTVATLIDSNTSKSPALTFEEFLVFLCAFSRLRFEGLLFTPHDMSSLNGAGSADNWFGQWQQFMGSSKSFRRLLSECILPVLNKRTLLAFPEDARLRDRFTCVFSVEVLTAIEGAEGPLQQFFQRERGESSHGTTDKQQINENSVGIAGIVAAMKRIRLVPNVVQESQVLQLIEDVLPERRAQRAKAVVETQVPADERLLFPQWEWVLSVVACQAVETAIQQCDAFSTSEKIPMLVADVVTSIASAMAAERK